MSRSRKSVATTRSMSSAKWWKRQCARRLRRAVARALQRDADVMPDTRQFVKNNAYRSPKDGYFMIWPWEREEWDAYSWTVKYAELIRK